MDKITTWDQALRDSGISSDTIDLAVVDGPLIGGVTARYLRGVRDRIEVRSDCRAEVLLAAVLRHELQHVRQVRSDGRLYELHGLAEEVALKGASDSSRNALYNSIPMERDANSAGHSFAVRMFGSNAVEDARRAYPGNPALTGNGASVPPAQLLEEMINWFVENASLCRRHALDGTASFICPVDPDDVFVGTLDLCVTGAGSLWRQRVLRRSQ